MENIDITSADFSLENLSNNNYEILNSNFLYNYKFYILFFIVLLFLFVFSFVYYKFNFNKTKKVSFNEKTEEFFSNNNN